MPWIEELSEPQELRRCIRDLIALSALPAVWKSYDPQQIAGSLAAALLSMLDADFVYIVERSSDFIDFAGLEGATQYINPAGLKLVGLEGIAEAGRAHVLDFILPVEQTCARDEV